MESAHALRRCVEATCDTRLLHAPLQLAGAAAIVAITYYRLTDFDLTAPSEILNSGEVQVTNYKCGLGRFENTGDDM
jgi:hypothetical protein